MVAVDGLSVHYLVCFEDIIYRVCSPVKSTLILFDLGRLFIGLRSVV